MSKTFLSIGSGPGIGFSTARRFGREGYRVVLSARNGVRLQAAATVLRSEGIEATTVKVDARDPQSVSDVVASIGPELEVLHYNAGVLHYDPEGRLQPRALDDETIDSLASDMLINVGSALAATHAAAHILASNGRGSILLTGGGLGVAPSADFLTLSVGKAAIRALALALFPSLRERGVHVATVTVGTLVSPDSRESEQIADAFWNLHRQPRAEWRAEQTYPAQS